MTAPAPRRGAAPDVTVVVPTKNRSRLLARAVRSALAQRDVSVQVVVVDDGSTDDTPGMLAACPDDRVVHLRHERSRGVSRARNAGLRRADGRYVAFLDDDDVWAPDKLREQLAACSSSGARWSCTGAVNVVHDLQPVSHHPALVEGDVLAELLGHNRIPGGASSVLVETALVRELGGFDESLSTLADWDLWIRLAQASPLAAVRRDLVGYYLHAGSMAHDVPAAEREYAQLAGKHTGLREQLGVALNRRYWLSYLASAALRDGDRRAAAALTWRTRDSAGPLRSGALALACRTVPGTLMAYRTRRSRRSVDPDVEAWLAPQRGALDDAAWGMSAAR